MMGKAGGSRLAQFMGAIAMTIARFLHGQAFDPDEVKVLTTAFEDTLVALGLIDRTDPATELVAKKIIELAKLGERDPVRLCQGAVKALSE
jgi:hypothetical protein